MTIEFGDVEVMGNLDKCSVGEGVRLKADSDGFEELGGEKLEAVIVDPSLLSR